MSTKHIVRYKISFIEKGKKRTIGHMYSREEAVRLQQRMEYELGCAAWVL